MVFSIGDLVGLQAAKSRLPLGIEGVGFSVIYSLWVLSLQPPLRGGRRNVYDMSHQQSLLSSGTTELSFDCAVFTVIRDFDLLIDYCPLTFVLLLSQT